jgi:hypothetical protein
MDAKISESVEYRLREAKFKLSCSFKNLIGLSEFSGTISRSESKEMLICNKISVSEGQ